MIQQNIILSHGFSGYMVSRSYTVRISSFGDWGCNPVVECLPTLHEQGPEFDLQHCKQKNLPHLLDWRRYSITVCLYTKVDFIPIYPFKCRPSFYVATHGLWSLVQSAFWSTAWTNQSSLRTVYFCCFILSFCLDATLLILVPLLQLNLSFLFLEIYLYDYICIFYYYSNWFFQLGKILKLCYTEDFPWGCLIYESHNNAYY
jgi:hypothetical protein